MFDVIIIGAGVTGLGTAWHLTETLKKKVLLIEQFTFPHQFGSSAGHSRIIRQLYSQDFNCILMKEAVNMWRDLENKTGESLFIQNGVLTFGPKNEMKAYLDAIEKSGISSHEITSTEVKERFPNFSIPKEHCVIFDPIGGVLKADKCLNTLMNQSIKNGLEFHELEKVLDISVISENEIKILTNLGQYQSKSVIITAGIWSDNFLKKLNTNIPLTPLKINYAYFKPCNESDLSLFNYDNLPSFISNVCDVYGLSGMEYPGCLKIGDFNSEEIDPDKRDAEGAKSLLRDKFLENIQTFLTEYIPRCSTVPINITTCVIMKTPDWQPIIDRLENFKNVIIGCGFSGCGFKSGVIHGKLLAELAMNTKSSYDIEHFSISRFNKKPL